MHWRHPPACWEEYSCRHAHAHLRGETPDVVTRSGENDAYTSTDSRLKQEILKERETHRGTPRMRPWMRLFPDLTSIQYGYSASCKIAKTCVALRS